MLESQSQGFLFNQKQANDPKLEMQARHKMDITKNLQEEKIDPLICNKKND